MTTGVGESKEPALVFDAEMEAKEAETIEAFNDEKEEIKDPQILATMQTMRTLHIKQQHVKAFLVASQGRPDGIHFESCGSRTLDIP